MQTQRYETVLHRFLEGFDGFTSACQKTQLLRNAACLGAVRPGGSPLGRTKVRPGGYPRDAPQRLVFGLRLGSGTLGTTEGHGNHSRTDDLTTHGIALLVHLGNRLVVLLWILNAAHGLMH